MVSVSRIAIPNDLLSEIRQRYIETKETYRHLAAQYNVSFYAIRDIARPQCENWRKLRDEYQKKVVKENAKNAKKGIGKRLERKDELLQKGFDRVEKILDSEDSKDPRKLYQAIRSLQVLCEMAGIKPPTDEKMQKAQIEKIEAETNLINQKANPKDSDDTINIFIS